MNYTPFDLGDAINCSSQVKGEGAAAGGSNMEG
jgi:hypothetical protein